MSKNIFAEIYIHKLAKLQTHEQSDEGSNIHDQGIILGSSKVSTRHTEARNSAPDTPLDVLGTLSQKIYCATFNSISL